MAVYQEVIQLHTTKEWSYLQHCKLIMAIRNILNYVGNLSQEPMNLANKNSFKFSGLVNKKAVGIENGPEGKGVTLVTKKQTSKFCFLFVSHVVTAVRCRR